MITYTPNLLSEKNTVDLADELISGIEANSTRRVGMALDQGANVNGRLIFSRTPCMVAALSFETECLLMLIHAGALLEARDHFGKTALMVACVNGCAKTAMALIHAGARIEPSCHKGKSAMDYAQDIIPQLTDPHSDSMREVASLIQSMADRAFLSASTPQGNLPPKALSL